MQSIKIISVTVSLFMIIGCSGPSGIDKQTNSNGPSYNNDPLYQTNMYGRLDGWKPVEFNAKPFSSLEQHSFCEEGGDYDPDVSADGKLIVFSSLRHSPNPDIYVKRVAGATSTRLTSDP
ncbi:MAG: PD40 domain-containing protein, partial [Sedimentisphaerales bacterium]|nr:PD40 domain-containing protein [Sedimentisphaerales bacterium]